MNEIDLHDMDILSIIQETDWILETTFSDHNSTTKTKSNYDFIILENYPSNLENENLSKT